MKKVEYDNQPARLQAVGNGSHLYRWGIEQVKKEGSEGIPDVTAWQCFEVLVWNNPTPNSVTEAAIAAMWPPTIEAKLINDYNAAKEGLLPKEFKAAYLEFITERKALKETIQAYFNESI